MYRQVMVISLATAFLASVPMSAYTAPDKLQYELQERCSNRVEKLFTKEWPNGSPDNSAGYTQLAGYQSHYNAKLNKCFALITIQAYDKQPKTSKSFLDVQSNKEYGQYLGDMLGHKSNLPPHCWFGEKRCNSEAEWDAMADVYMEEDGTGYNLLQTQR